LSKETVGLISGLIIALNVIPYVRLVWQRKNTLKLTSWLLWTFIGFALLVTFKSSGATYNIWPAVFGFTNPLIITIILLIRQRSKVEKLTEKTDLWCFGFGVIALTIWYFVQDDSNHAQYALYLSIIADAFAAIPTLIFLWKKPQEDRPFAWGMFAIGYGLSVFAISDHTFANYSLPVYMFLGSSFLTMLLVIYRIKNSIPLKEWI
jgi:uncharacterized protein with PQ loop repeat